MSANQTHNSKVIAIAAWCVANDLVLDTDHSARYQPIGITDYDDKKHHAQRIAQFLFDANVEALHTRYPDLAAMAPGDDNNLIYQDSIEVKTAHVATEPLSPAKVMRCISDYDYQTCELKGYDKSTVFRFLRSVGYKLADVMSRREHSDWLSDQDKDLQRFEVDAKTDGTTGPISLMALGKM